MPIFKATGKLIYYAHVPKCGGSAVESYLIDRFGTVAFHNTTYLSQSEALRWTRTSPQHVDADALSRLFPAGFFDAAFTIVRHPVGRMVSAYHFHLEVERSIPAGLSFAEWLEDIPEVLEERPYAFDNHIRPMADLVPQGAEVFYLEHGLRGLVPWCDAVSGVKDGPRAVPHINKKGDFVRSAAERVVPSEAEIARIAEIYAADFARFAYEPDEKEPSVAPPELSDEILREHDEALAAMNAPLNRLKGKVRRVLKRH